VTQRKARPGVVAVVACGAVLWGAVSVTSLPAVSASVAGDEGAKSVASPSLADVPPEMLEQAEQDEAWEEAYDRFADLPGWGGGRFSTEGDVKTVTLFWAGEVPRQVLDFASEPHGVVTVRIESVAYSEREFEADMMSLNEQAKAKGFTLVEVTVSEDSSHLVVGVRSETERARAESLAHRIPVTTRVTGSRPMDMSLATDSEFEVLTVLGAGRQQDNSPFWAGAPPNWGVIATTAIKAGLALLLAYAAGALVLQRRRRRDP
jgi:hypothetical protein